MMVKCFSLLKVETLGKNPGSGVSEVSGLRDCGMWKCKHPSAKFAKCTKVKMYKSAKSKERSYEVSGEVDWVSLAGCENVNIYLAKCANVQILKCENIHIFKIQKEKFLAR